MHKSGAVSNVVFGASVIVLLIIAVAGFGLYLTSSQSVSTTTATTTSTSVQTSTETVTPNATGPGVSGGFLGGNVVTFFYPTQPICTPTTGQLFPNQTAASAVAPCEVGAAGTFPNNAIPFWVLVPAFAGLSIFGVPALGASPQGYAVYNNQTLLTDCGAGGTATGCPMHPTFLYSPAFTAVEQHLNISSGYGGLPEGVLPTPAHDHIVDTNASGVNVPWATIAVLVFDPNIIPNAATGQCTQVVPSSLQNATGNCLTSLAALERSMTTNNSEIAAANAGNPIWQTLGGPTLQVVIPGDSSVSQVSTPNSNLDIYFPVSNASPYPPTQQSQPYPPAQQSHRPIEGAIGVSAIVGAIGLVVLRRSEESSGPGKD